MKTELSDTSLPEQVDGAVRTGQGSPLGAKIERLGRELMQFPQIDCPIRHHFAPGMYAREITIPAGTLLVGMVHKTDNLVVVSKGTLQLVTEGGVIEISAPHTLMCKAGARNAAHAVTDVVWTNFFPTTETDTDKLIELFTEATADEVLGGCKNEQLLANRAKQLEV